ncbi:MAG: hypothetical protein R3194_02510 [Limnobacter sp.]|nr:hypothetical protein [Limnobacter sp.]
MKVGVFIPTTKRPELIRSCVSQWLLQTRQPDLICVHQNGQGASYEWAIDDLRSVKPIDWLYTPKSIPRIQWYLPAIEHLYEQGCTHFFWGDHDDMYQRHHIQTRLEELEQRDFTIAQAAGVVILAQDKYQYSPRLNFLTHPPRGQSASMAFTRRFAKALIDDLHNEKDSNLFADQVLANTTVKRFDYQFSKKQSTVNVSHKDSVTSHTWLKHIE